MDTKQAQINVFTEGLNTDLHPLTTPNNILTDCINGTVITYNGNEFILQNDMGNYKLEKAKLPSDYIPVGVKEYGGIIYIVFYVRLVHILPLKHCLIIVMAKKTSKIT